MLLADLSATLLMLLQYYWISLGAFLSVLFILSLSLLSPFLAGLSALFSKENRRASLARVVAFICCIFHYGFSFFQPPDLSNAWNTRREDDKWWLLPTVLLLFKLIQARFVDWHIANLEIQDYSLFCPDPDAFFGHLRLAHKRKERQYIKVPMSLGFSVILIVTSEALILCFGTSVAYFCFVNVHRCAFHRCIRFCFVNTSEVY